MPYIYKKHVDTTMEFEISADQTAPDIIILKRKGPGYTDTYEYMNNLGRCKREQNV